VAKKVRKKTDELEEYRSFQFPSFDESRFLTHEFDQMAGTLAAISIAVGLGIASFFITHIGIPYVPVVLALVVVIFSPSLIRRIHRPVTPFTKGEWAGFFLMEIFGWLGIWFLLLNLYPAT
jgi:hypothetical protein